MKLKLEKWSSVITIAKLIGEIASAIYKFFFEDDD